MCSAYLYDSAHVWYPEYIYQHSMRALWFALHNLQVIRAA